MGAGWGVPGTSRYPVVGNSGELSIVAHERYARNAKADDDPAVFELVDRRRVIGYWTRGVPTSRQAAVLLDEHGGPPEEEPGKPPQR